MTPGDFVLVTAIEALSAAVQGSAGFGLNVVAVPLLALVSPKFVPGPVLLAGLAISLLVGHRERKNADWPAVKWIALGRLPGSVAGAVAVAVLAPRRLTTTIAVLVLLSVLVSLLGVRIIRSTRNLVLWGLVSGVMGTAAGLGGTPLAVLYQHGSGPSVRGSLSLNAALGCIMSLVLLVVVGAFDVSQIRLGLLLLPGVALGYLVSWRVVPHLDRGRTRPAVLILCTLAAGLAVARSIAW